MLKIDIHTHILPQNIPPFQKKFGYGGFIQLQHTSSCCARMVKDDGTFFREVESNCWDAAVRMAECDARDVSVQALSTVPVMFHYWAKPRDALETSKFLNDHIAEVVSAHPKRFVGLGTLPLQDPALAIEELERCVKELGFPGVQIGSHVNSWNLDADELFPVFEAAEKLGAAVFVHPWEMLGSERMPKYWMPWLVGMPAETCMAICSMIFGGVFERLPKLRVAFAHGGGSFPATIGRISHGFEVRPDLCAVKNKVDPKHYLGKFFVDALVHDERALRFLLDVMGAHRVALGSDYPFPLGEDFPGKMMADSSLFTEEEKLSVFQNSALEWLYGEKSKQAEAVQRFLS